MPARHVVTVYSDYKSPYAYLAKDEIYALSAETSAESVWKPYILDIPQYLGSARVDAAGNVLEENRNAHQWRRVRYSYMDCRRQARKQGLIIRGTRKIWDSSAGRRRACCSRNARGRGIPALSRHGVRAVLAPRPGHRVQCRRSPRVLRDVAGATGFADWADAGRAEVAWICVRRRRRAFSACRASLWTANYSGGGSICRISGRCSPRQRHPERGASDRLVTERARPHPKPARRVGQPL